MKYTLTFSFLCLTLFIHAQPAPDFTITDSDGQQHQLYADYLNQGKSVLLKVFFTTCPPCNSIAPLMQPLYQDWGAGEMDVEFFDLSDKSFDTDVLVNAYKANHNHTYPAAGVEGGSLSAVQPYKNGMYGPFLGTPTFIVIAPDGTVTWDVRAAGNQATIQAIDQALLATGAEKPKQKENPVTVSGNVDGALGIPNMKVFILDGAHTAIDSVITDENGQYSFSVLPTEVQPNWRVEVIKTDDPTAGVSAVDLIVINKHILGVEPFTTVEKKIAADVNSNISVNVADILNLIKVLLGINPNFLDGKSWVTYPSDLVLDNSTNHAPMIPETSIPLEAIMNGTRSGNFKAVKKGNVN